MKNRGKKRDIYSN